MTSLLLPKSPYVGLVPYSEDDAPFFFGREREVDLIIANLLTSRLTVIYGESGVGKSSVLRAGVSYTIGREAKRMMEAREKPRVLAVPFASWGPNAAQALLRRLDDLLSPYAPGNGSIEPTKHLDEALQKWSELTGSQLLIILDQFEEYFLYQDQESGTDSFAEQFARAVNNPEVAASFLISLRADALAKLDRFTSSIPSLLDNCLRIDHLDRKQARSAIELPVKEYNRGRGPDVVNVEPELVEAVLDEVAADNLAATVTGQSIASRLDDPSDQKIETAYLQLVLTRLWSETTARGSHTLELSTLKRLGGAKAIARTHLDQVLAALPQKQKETAAAIFGLLVTPSGAKIAHYADDLAFYAKKDLKSVRATLERLSNPSMRVIRTVAAPPGESNEPRYEIFHDILGVAIPAWRTRFLEEQTSRLRMRAGAGLGVVVLAAAAVAGFSRMSVSDAENDQSKAQAVAKQVVGTATSAAIVANLKLEEVVKLTAPTLVPGAVLTMIPTPIPTTIGLNTCEVPGTLPLVNIRSGPDTSFSQISFLRAADRFSVEGWRVASNAVSGKPPSSRAPWFKVTLLGSGTKGWVSTQPVDDPNNTYNCTFPMRVQAEWPFGQASFP